MNAGQGRWRSWCWLAPGDDVQPGLFTESIHIKSRTDAPAALARLGGSRARLVAAVTGDDLLNITLAEAALGKGHGRVAVRIEDRSLRALKSHQLRRLGEEKAREVTILALGRLRLRAGFALAMPGRYVDQRAARHHVVLCGNGPDLAEAALHVVRQAYGLETRRPLLSVLQAGGADLPSAIVAQLKACDAVELRLSSADPADPFSFDRAFSTLAADADPVSAVHCLGPDGEAAALALRCEAVFMDLGLFVPPVIAHGGDVFSSRSGMARTAGHDGLAGAQQAELLLDRRAMLAHDAYLANQRSSRGGKFGELPAECSWAQLPESYRDDNRNAADHLAWKLARIGMVIVPDQTGDALTPDDIERLSEIEHARWMAAKSLAGWRHGPLRDDRKLLHPDMIAYAGLSEAAKDKDRAEVRALPALLALGGEALRREQRMGLAEAKAERSAWPVVPISIDTPAGLAEAEAVLAAGVPLEAVLTVPPTQAFSGDTGFKTRAAAILQQAWRIRIPSETAGGAGD